MCLILSILMNNVACENANHNLNAWVSDKTNGGEKFLCKLEHNEDYFLVVQSGDKLKVVYRLDVTSLTSKPQSFIISWQFKNEKDEFIGLPVLSEDISRGYVSQGNRVYYEALSYMHVYVSDLQHLKINIGLKKYISSDEVPSATDLNDNDLEDIKLCDVPLLKST